MVKRPTERRTVAAASSGRGAGVTGGAGRGGEFVGETFEQLIGNASRERDAERVRQSCVWMSVLDEVGTIFAQPIRETVP